MSKIVVVTGAGTGVGRRVAEVLSKEGMVVYLIGRRKDKLIETQNLCPGQTEVLQCDVSDPQAVKNAFEIVEKNHKRIDVLFNNAGIGVPAQSIDEMPFENWKSVVDINLNGMFLCAKYAYQMMKKQRPKGGRIINNGSISAFSPRPKSLAYTTSKHAITGLTKSLALDGREDKIVCSQIDIGNALTPLTKAFTKGVLQPNGSKKIESTMNVENVVELIVLIQKLPLNTNILNTTIMANDMPFIGRG